MEPHDFALAWTHVNAGVALAASEDFEWSASAGQPLTELSAGGPYTLQSGFWAAAPMPFPPKAPSLSVGWQDGRLRLGWPSADGLVLEAAETLEPGGLWRPVVGRYHTEGGYRSLLVLPANTARFFRLRWP